jgi:His-Xaa-Ser system protein HxsD
MDRGNTETVRFDANAYSIDTIKKAAYRYLDCFAPEFEVSGNTIVCQLTFPTGTDVTAIAETVADFRKEVLDQDLRQIVSVETVAYRNAILALAFSSSHLTKDE